MPHNNHTTHSRHGGSSGDDLGSTDEVKVFKDEGDREDEKNSSENLLVEEKSSLIDLTESEEKGGKIVVNRPEHSSVFSKLEPHAAGFNMGYLMAPYAYGNGSPGGLPVSMANKIGLPPFFCHNGDPLSTPPPAHCGIPPYQLDPKAIGLTRPALYSFSSGQYPYPMLNPDMSQVASWHTPSVYSPASSFRSPYPASLPINTTLPSDFPFRFSPSLLPSVHTSPHHVLNSHPTIIHAGPKPGQDCNQESSTSHRYSRNMDAKSTSQTQGNESKDHINDKKKNHIKKPLNAFMLYMKEMRAKVVAECTLKESAAINQILGRRWHELTREEQSKYYEKARQERQLHMELYPGWSARDNYGYVSKKKKRKKDRSPADSGGNNMKKCRARFGLDQQNQWCKPCRRKKKCIRYMEAGGGSSGGSNKDDGFNEMEDMEGQMSDDSSADSGDETISKQDDDNESLNQSINSPGCLSALSSLQSKSPSTSLASPLNLQPSPAATATSSVMANNEQQQQQPPPHLKGFGTHQSSMLAAHQSLLQQHQEHQNMLNHHKKQQQQHQQQLLCQQIQQQQQQHANQQQSLAPPLHALASNNRISAAANAFNASSQASLSDRMMRSIFSTNPAMLLGNRLSHLAMGLSVSSNSNEQFNKTTANSPTLISDNGLQMPSCKQTDNLSAAASPLSAFVALNSSIDGLHDKLQLPAQRSPIGANPRDINNPLNISQLTNRGGGGGGDSFQNNNSSSANEQQQRSAYQQQAQTQPQLSTGSDVMPNSSSAFSRNNTNRYNHCIQTPFNQHHLNVLPPPKGGLNISNSQAEPTTTSAIPKTSNYENGNSEVRSVDVVGRVDGSDGISSKQLFQTQADISITSPAKALKAPSISESVVLPKKAVVETATNSSNSSENGVISVS